MQAVRVPLKEHHGKRFIQLMKQIIDGAYQNCIHNHARTKNQSTADRRIVTACLGRTITCNVFNLLGASSGTKNINHYFRSYCYEKE